MLDLSKFQSKGVETCFHDRHIGAQIYADLNGSNWSIKDYEARGGYAALRKILGKEDYGDENVMGAMLAYDKQGFQVNYLGKDVNVEFSLPH